VALELLEEGAAPKRNMPLFHEWRPDSRGALAISSSGFSTKLATLEAARRGREVLAALDVAVPVSGQRGSMPKTTSCPGARRPAPRPPLGEMRLVGHVVVGGQHQHHASGVLAHELVRDDRDRGRGAAARRARVERASDAPGAHLVLDQEPVVQARDHGRGLDAAHAGEARERFLERAGLAEQRQELFRVALARHRPQSRAGAPGEDDGMDGHGVSRRFRGA
jgi:hypothetical protein